jgi:hypothetical protein
VSRRPGSDDKVGSEDYVALLNYFRGILVNRWQERLSMETILGSAGLSADKYLIQAPRPEDCWFQALKRICKNNKLLIFINIVQDELDERDETLGRLYALEKERQEKAKLKLQANVVEAFTYLLERLRFAANYTAQLREPEHLETKDLAAIKDYLTDLYRLLDGLKEALRATSGRNDEIAQAGDLEARVNKCTDALQLYITLLQHVNPADDMVQFGATGAHGDLGGRANDEIVLLRAKAWLRNALIRLSKAGGGR